MKRNKPFKLITPTDKTGWLFVLPFVLGFAWLFFKPALESLAYTVNKITVGENGLVLEYIGWSNFDYLFNRDAEFTKALITLVKDMAVKILVIMFISMFLAVLLNNKFPGRLLFRAVLFLPMIFGADLVMELFTKVGGEAGLQESSNSFVMMAGEATGFVEEVIESFGFLAPVIKKFTEYSGELFNLLWSVSLQTVLFIIGLQAIPAHLYEVAEMEGATKWETFWKITFPLLMPSILLCLIYTIIDYFNASSNAIVKMISMNMMNRIDYACTMSWVYSVVLFLFVLVVNAVVSRKIISMD